jgi:hypothetical protein
MSKDVELYMGYGLVTSEECYLEPIEHCYLGEPRFKHAELRKHIKRNNLDTFNELAV